MDIRIEEIKHRFKYHKPKEVQIPVYERFREAGKKLALDMLDSQPHSRELSLAITKLEEAIMWANAGIARNT